MSRSGAGFLLVRSGTRRVGLELSQVVEVTEAGQARPVPSLEPAMRGVLAIKGRILPVVHLGALLDMASPPPPTSSSLVVVVTVDGRHLCLEVDEAEVVVHEPRFPVPQDGSLAWAVAVARHQGTLVPLLDLAAVGARLAEMTPA